MDNRILVAAAQWGASQAQQTTEKGTACSTSNFRKKPVVIQAKQLTEETIREVYEWVHGPVTLKHRLAEDRWDDYCGIVTTDGMNIPTLEDGSDGRAKHVASIGDWIIRGIAGEFYPCKPDIFAATYEPVAQAQQTTEPELPEPEAIRHSFDGYGWMYIDNGHGSGWRSGIDKADAEFMYTAAQMHEHYAAGVRAGAARSQDWLSQVISGAIFDFAGYLTTRTNVIEVGSTANASPVADLVKEWAALRGLSLDDAAVLSWQEWLNAAMQGGQQP